MKKEILKEVKKQFLEAYDYLYYTWNNNQGKDKEWYKGYETALEDIKRKMLGRICKLMGEHVPEAEDESSCVKCNSSLVHNKDKQGEKA